MKADYKNWMPKGMIFGFAAASVAFAVAGGMVCALMADGAVKTAVVLTAFIVSIICIMLTVWCVLLYKAFDYDGRRKMSKQIIEGVSDLVRMPEGGAGLDVGCGSGALIIACAKKNPGAKMIGIDRWGMEYASFSELLCAQNAKAEGVGNVKFERGDARQLQFEDETFDAVTSNYVYHNIPSKDRRELLEETLRCLKKGGAFAIHDIFSKARYGDMQEFIQKLKDSGYEKVDLIDTTDGMFMTRKEALFMGLSGSAILCGRK